jgi:acyl-CoA reductase-like NAD-dependent aldehyde dehydrogenase
LHDSRLPLVSFTGSTKTGRHVSKMVASRFGKTILELGGNNASIVMADADLDMAYKGSVFAAAGTCG